MNHVEAIQAMLDGEKITHIRFEKEAFLAISNNRKFIYVDKNGDRKKVVGAFNFATGYEVLKEESPELILAREEVKDIQKSLQKAVRRLNRLEKKNDEE